MPLCNYLPANLARILLEIAIFMPEMPFNSASVLIRSSKFFLGICQIRWLCMIIRLLPTPIPLLLRRNLCRFPEFYAKMLSGSKPFHPVQFGIRSVLKLICVK
jgi:hypothetical protein